MQTLLSLTAVVLSLVTGARADQKVAAPLPKPQEAPALEGTYTVNYTYLSTGFERGGGFGGPGGARQPVTKIALRTSGATITKNEISIGNNNFDGGWGGGYYDGPGGPGGPNANTQTMTYSIDPTKTPMAIDLFSVDVRNKKTKSLGIIEVLDERITISVAKPGAERPKNLEETEEVTLYYFKKAPPPPKTEFKIVAMTVGKEAEAEKELNRLAKEGYELVNTTNPSAADSKTSPTTVHFILKRTGGK